MMITLLGYAILPVGMLLFLFSNDEYLLYATFLTSGMTGSSVFSLGDTGIQPSYYFALLWMIREMLLAVKKGELKLKKSLISLEIFLVIAIISTGMPIFLNKKVTIMNVDGYIEQLHYSTANLTQIVYLMFCCTFMVFFCSKINRDNYEKYLKFYIRGLVIVFVITLYQIIAYRYDLIFDQIFRTGLHARYTPTLFWDKRLSGPCLEASMLAYYLMPALPIIARSSKKYIKYGLSFGFVFLGVMSQSSTFLVGMVVWLILEITLVLFKKEYKLKCNKKMIVMSICILGLFCGILFVTGRIQNIIISITEIIEQFQMKLKRQNLSGVERSETFELLFDAFTKSPLLGVGFGSSRGKDLFSTWLANTGLFGIASIMIFIIAAIKKSRNLRGIQISVILVWICMFISVPEPYNLFIWILMAFALNAPDSGLFGVNKCEKCN